MKKVKSAPFLLLVIICAFFLQRFGLILFGFSHIAYPGFDETASGVLASDLLDGTLRVPLFAYQYESRSGDGLIEGIALVPLFKAMGRTLFSLKILALFSAFFCLVFWIAIMKRYHGIWTAIIFAALFALPPPMFARLNLVGTIGSHHLINPLIALQILILFLIMEYKEKKPSLWLIAGFGLLAGLGSYTFYTCLIFNAFCILFIIIFRQKAISIRSAFCFTGGFLAGFSPWIVRSFSSPAGGGYLLSLIKNLNFNPLNVIRNFTFTIAHSFGFSYPVHRVGFTSLFFYLFIVFFTIIIVKSSLSAIIPLRNGFDKIPSTALQTLFFALFLIFFLSCLSLSPMRIKPFEYWPTVGLFSSFSCADIYRYRWVHMLFPFYFAIIASGITSFRTSYPGSKLPLMLTVIPLVFFVLSSLGTSLRLCSKNDFSKIFFYKSFNYDLMANRFLLRGHASESIETAKLITLSYPQDNKPEAYKCLGTMAALHTAKALQGEETVKQLLEEVPSSYRNDFIYGIVRAAQNLSESEFEPLKNAVTGRYPMLFYKNWGYRHVGYKYYGLLVNQKKLLQQLSPLQQWFFQDVLREFKQQIKTADRNALFHELDKLPFTYRYQTVKGLGMLIGAEMLFDPASMPDYPLNSHFGEQLKSPFKEAFYEGIGSGFAVTLYRLWRTLLLPEGKPRALYAKMLNTDWERCVHLMSALDGPYLPIVKKGFREELKNRYLNKIVQQYLSNRLKAF